jgi:hypothetical protein
MTTNPASRLEACVAEHERLTVLGRGPSAVDGWIDRQPTGGTVVADPTYSLRDVFDGEPCAVLIGDLPRDLDRLARRFHATDPDRRPLLMHAYLPEMPAVDFAGFDLPRPTPFVPLLIRSGLYRHRPNEPHPTTGVFALLVAAALQRPTTAAGIDLYRHPSGKRYAAAARRPPDAPTPPPPDAPWPARHSFDCDLQHVRLAANALGDRGNLHPILLAHLGPSRGNAEINP